MPNTKEKLVELIDNYTDPLTVRDIHKAEFSARFADHLIANGVTLDNQVASSTWISVKDRLPEDSTYVLARLSGGAIYEALCLTKGSKQWCAINREPFVNKDTVTHWMPLPQPSKGE